MVSMLSSFSARDKIIQRSVNTIARDECSMAIESQRNILLSLLCMKKKVIKRQRRFTVMKRRARTRRLEEFQKQQAQEAALFLACRGSHDAEAYHSRPHLDETVQFRLVGQNFVGELSRK